MNKEKMEWIIASHNSDEDRIVLQRVYGTVEEIKNQLMSTILTVREEFQDFYEFGTECIDDIDEFLDLNNENIKELHGYLNFVNFHIEYSAVALEAIERI